MFQQDLDNIINKNIVINSCFTLTCQLSHQGNIIILLKWIITFQRYSMTFIPIWSQWWNKWISLSQHDVQYTTNYTRPVTGKRKCHRNTQVTVDDCNTPRYMVFIISQITSVIGSYPMNVNSYEFASALLHDQT